MIKFCIIMDPIEFLHFSKDSTLAILFEAVRRDWIPYYMQQTDLILKERKVYGKMQRLHVDLKKEHQVKGHQEEKNMLCGSTFWYQLEEPVTHALSDFNFILMRKDPPVDMNYIYATHLLDIAEKQGAYVLNKPASLCLLNEKIFATWFPNCCPPTLISANFLEIKNFLVTHGEIVVKPLYGMGGEGIFRVSEGELNFKVIWEMLTKKGRQAIIAQRYLPEIKDGDKRVLIIDGEPFDYALARIPSLDDIRGNLAAGGRGVAVPLGQRERQICSEVGPILREKGLFFVGLDIIGDYLTEINITSPTCIRELEQQTSLNISSYLLDALEKRLV